MKTEMVSYHLVGISIVLEDSVADTKLKIKSEVIEDEMS